MVIIHITNDEGRTETMAAVNSVNEPAARALLRLAHRLEFKVAVQAPDRAPVAIAYLEELIKDRENEALRDELERAEHAAGWDSNR